ncbi:alpha-L-rhamnosidase C-terminal domain-containing protein [Cohnella sp. GCM10027633]|uniref:alpha-L-rhamnosidase C-terminal domain-containing protein n=1 Tax=unclassified Cohnella TaxID=2636738 RepID=UPI003643889E
MRISYSPHDRRLVPDGFVPFDLQPGQKVRFDFGLKRAGLLHMELGDAAAARSQIRYAYTSDDRLFSSLYRCFEDEAWVAGRFPTYVRMRPYGQADQWLPIGNGAYLLEEDLTVLRYLELDNRSGEPLSIRRLWLEYTAAPYQPVGGFECNDDLINECWTMGTYTVELCSQPSQYTQRSLQGPYSDYVIWDGVRRDKDIWGGDLRPASLTALYAFDKPEIVKNTIEMLLTLQHMEGEEQGIIPGSGAYGQIFYEWTMWTIVNLWEYVLLTGDLTYLRANVGRLCEVVTWMNRRMESDGLISGLNSWMYSIEARGKISGLAMAQKAAWDALDRLFALAEHPLQEYCRQQAERTKRSILAQFSVPGNPLLTMMPAGAKERDRYAIDGNLWAILHDVVDPARARLILREIEKQFWTERGSINVVPIFDEALDGEWWWDVLPQQSAVWRHNNNIWPYMSAYETLASFHAGQTDRGLEVMRRVGRSHLEQGHKTYWEMMNINGGLPIGDRGDTLSLTHAWGGTGSYGLQAYVAGVRPLTPGFGSFSVMPSLGSLDWIKAEVPTPHGLIEVEAERTRSGEVRGTVKCPGQTECRASAGMEKLVR